MNYYSQEKTKFYCSRWNTCHEMNMANVIQSFHDSITYIKCGLEYICACSDLNRKALKKKLTIS